MIGDVSVFKINFIALDIYVPYMYHSKTRRNSSCTLLSTSVLVLIAHGCFSLHNCHECSECEDELAANCLESVIAVVGVAHALHVPLAPPVGAHTPVGLTVVVVRVLTPTGHSLLAIHVH